MQARRFQGAVDTLWGDDPLPAPPQAVRREGAAGRRMAPPVRVAGGAWYAWQQRLQGNLLLGVGLYFVAHVLLGLSILPSDPLFVQIERGAAILLFVFGTLAVWKLLVTLNDPIAALNPNAGHKAGAYLAISMAMAFSPCAWFFLLGR